MTTDNERLIAYHEAGHVVAALRFGSMLAVVNILRHAERERLGVSCDDSEDECSLEEHRIILCAGYCAEIEAGGDEGDARMGAGSDFSEVPPDALDDSIANAFEFVRAPKNWKAIEVIAEELLRLKHIEGQEAEVLLALADGECTPEDVEKFRLMAGEGIDENRRAVVEATRRRNRE